MHRLRDLRRAHGLTQAQLAAAAGVSRQLVGALEAGRHEPGVGAALALARALGTDVETLFGGVFGAAPHGAAPVGVDGRPLPDGPVALARTGERLVGITVAAAAQLAGHPVDGEVHGGVLHRRTRSPERILAVGCDPALGVLAASSPPDAPLLWAPAPTGVATAAIRAGRAHLGAVHDRTGHLPSPAPGVGARPLARVRVGLALAGHPRSDRSARRRAVSAVRRGPVVQRPAGATSQRAFERWLRRQGLGHPPGPRVADHLDAARLVAAGAAPLGVTSEPAAAALGLGFVPLETHEVWVWWHTGLLGSAAEPHRGILDLLGTPEFGDRLWALPGYERPRAA